MTVAVREGGEVGVQARLPEAFGDKVDDASLGLQGRGGAEEGGGFGEGSVLV